MKVEEAINEIVKNGSEGGKKVYNTKNAKDEITIMKAMLNDKDYKVDIYKGSGKVDTYCPSEEVRGTFSNILKETTGISADEATRVMDNYEFKNADAKTAVNLSKQFIYTYLETGRKLPLGGRDKINASLTGKVIPEGMVKYPMKTGKFDKDGKEICEIKEKHIDSYSTIKVTGPCPSWVKNKQ